MAQLSIAAFLEVRRAALLLELQAIEKQLDLKKKVKAKNEDRTATDNPD